MSNLLEVTGEDIAHLDDSSLRELIGLLCEADYRSAGLPVKDILWGGNQDARDGGLDVVVRGDVDPPLSSFVPRKRTGFQVKKPDMPRAEILKEMKPGGSLRDEIKDLIAADGAYIIVSSTGSTTNTSLRNRTDAMEEAISKEANLGNLHLDFYERGRIASWVRCHPALVLWVRNKVGRPLIGWQPYDNWANTPGGIDEEYFLDEGLRLHDGTTRKDEGMSIEDGVTRLRTALSTPGTSVRLAGLSGVGKTRLVQALFDTRLGTDALNPSQVFYADISDGPTPDPKHLAEQLIADKSRSVIIVDNCPPELHRRLTPTCTKRESTVSLLTVEYDIREDLPEETSVFRLEPASHDLIEKIIRNRFQHISEVDARTIAEFSGGNSRVAIALSNTVEKGETLSSFQDEELFQRLFRQRNDSSETLLKSAEICSLVYSFEGTDVDSNKSELRFLASFSGASVTDLYRDVNTLKERGLIQTRNVWRAILPHAIANRLAKHALENIPKNKLIQSFLTEGSERLIKSFTRRLSYLHDSETAKAIVDEWLSQDGWLGKTNGNFSKFGIHIFKNIAPVSPEGALNVLERAAYGNDGSKFTSRENQHFYEFVSILRHLAYDQDLFFKSVDLLCRFALSERSGENHNSIRDVVKSLFFIYLSGTHATAEARAAVIKELIVSEDQDRQQLGLFLLDAALEAWHFSASGNFDFGARRRDYGFRPQNRKDVYDWYEIFISLCTEIAASSNPLAEDARRIFSNNLRGLWTKAGMHEMLVKSSALIHQKEPWNEGWIQIKGIIRYDAKGFSEEALEKLHNLEELLRPNELLERARTFALSKDHSAFDLTDTMDEDDASSAWRRAEETTCQIGIEVANNLETLQTILPELLSQHSMRLFAFGKGLATAHSDKKHIWQILLSGISKIAPEKRQISLLLGYLAACAEQDAAFYNNTLDGLVDDEILGELFPILQTSSQVDKHGVKRLHKSLELDRAKIGTYQSIGYGRAHELISDDDLAELLLHILSKQHGLSVTIEILSMRFHGKNADSAPYSSKLIVATRDALSLYNFSNERGSHYKQDYELSQIANICLVGEDGYDAALKLCKNIISAVVNNKIYSFDYPSLFNTIARLQPLVFLDQFVDHDKVENYHRKRIFKNEIDEESNNPLNQITDADLISWCDENPSQRYPLVASVIQAFSKSGEPEPYEWRPVVHLLLSKAPNVVDVLENLANSLYPSSGSGSLADALQRRSVLLEKLFDHENIEIGAWVKNQYQTHQEVIKSERKREESRDSKRDESFE